MALWNLHMKVCTSKCWSKISLDRNIRVFLGLNNVYFVLGLLHVVLYI